MSSASGENTLRNETQAETERLLAMPMTTPDHVAEVPLEAIPAVLCELSARQAELSALQSALVARLVRSRRDGARSSTSGSPDTPNECYLSARQIAERIPYAEKTIRNLKSAEVLREGEHYIKLRGRVMYSWPAMKVWVESGGFQAVAKIPLVRSKQRGR
jgi:hypothetical protein